MTKRHRPQPSYTAFNPTPRSPSNGKHRRTSPSRNSDPVQPSGAGDYGAPTDISPHDPWNSFTTYNTLNARVGPSIAGIVSNAKIIAMQRQMNTMMMDVLIYRHAKRLVQTEPFEPTPIPYRGIRTGEVIGHRLWYTTQLEPSRLCSLAHYHLWEPGRIETGDTKSVVLQHLTGDVYGGIYTFNTHNKLAEEIGNELLDYKNSQCFGERGIFNYLHLDNRRVPCTGLVSGTVSLWGDVVTHAHGYRASHAKVRTIDKVWGTADLDLLRSTYRINANDPRPNA